MAEQQHPCLLSGIGRLVFGKLSDIPCISRDGNRIYLQQLSFCCLGVCTMLMTTAEGAGQYR